MIWKQHGDEPSQAFQAFTLYRDMGAARTLKAICEKLDRPDGYLRQIEKWSSEFEWVIRARSYDAYLDELARREREAAWKSRASQHLEDEWQARDKLLKRANEMLEHPTTQKVIDSDEGVTVIEPANWNARDIAMFFDAASKLGRKATGLEDDERDSLKVDEGRSMLNLLITIVREEVKDASTLASIERRIQTSFNLEDPLTRGAASPS
jgi:hypothetical protein